jgi:cadmium resistance protein CadD (predicted permease)
MEIIITSLLVFISTNIDDVFLLMLFFGDKRFKEREIVIGQYLGIGTLIAISLALSLLGLVIDKAYIGLLGFIPVYLGMKGIISVLKKSTDAEQIDIVPRNNRSNIFSVAGVTIANGGDNVGIYVPLFAALSWPAKTTMIGIFFIMTAMWCLLARYLTRHPLVARTIDRYGHIVTPIVLILLGIYILYESNSWSLITE